MLSRRSLLKTLGWAVPGITVLEGLRRAGASLGLESQVEESQGDSAFFRKGWERDLGAYRLPDWFASNRVQAHAGLSLKWSGRPEFSQTPRNLAELGAQVLSRYMKTADEDPWWPTATMTSADHDSVADQVLVKRYALPRDFVRRTIEDMHAHGLKAIAYYWHMADATANRMHPEWVCRQPDGRAVKHRRGEHLDITSAYRDVILNRLLELGALGIDGFFFDDKHLPASGCWGTTLAQGFRDETGFDPPRRADENDSLYRSFLDYQAYRVEETFAYWRREVHARYPEIVFVISASWMPALANRRVTTNLIRLADSAKTEFYHAARPGFNQRIFAKNPTLPEPRKDIRMAVAWTILRDSAESRPPRIGGPGFATPQDALAATGAVLTYGGIMNINVYERDLIGTQPTHVVKRESARQVFTLGNLVSPYFKDTTPLRWAAVHYSELARNRRGGDLVRAWREILWPVNGAFEVFVQQGVPIGTVDDFQLETNRLDGYQVLFLPAPRELTPRQQHTVERFRASGGTVIEQDPAWRWDDSEAQSAARDALRAQIQPHLATAPGRLDLPRAKIHSGMFRNDVATRIVILVTNDFSWARTKRKMAKRLKGVTPPPPVSGVNVSVLSQRPPKRVYDVLAATDLDSDVVAGRMRVRIPTFQTLAVVNIELG